MGARVARRARPRARGAGRPDSRRRSTSTRRRSPAPRRRCSPRPRRRASPRSATPPASRTSSSCASSCAAMGVGDRRASGSHTIRVEGVATAAAARTHDALRRLHRGGQLGGGRRDHRRRRSRSAARGRVDIEVVAVGARARWACSACRTTTCFRVEPSKLVGAGRITTGLWPGFPSDLVSLVTVLATQAEGAHAGARLDVRAAAVRARADERHGRRPVPLRSAPHHRHRADAAARARRSTAATSGRAWR